MTKPKTSAAKTAPKGNTPPAAPKGNTPPAAPKGNTPPVEGSATPGSNTSSDASIGQQPPLDPGTVLPPGVSNTGAVIDNTPPKAPEVPDTPIFTHRIAGIPEHGFYRAGRHWPREGVEVLRADFTDEQWATLEAEPRLVISSL